MRINEKVRFLWRSQRLLSVWLSACLGFFYALYQYGWGVIDPSHVNWLLLEGDPFQHFIGWDAFRHDVWRWPLGRIPNFGTRIDSSIVFTDSIPLLAILFKLLSDFLPDPFQYQGLVMLLNATLNAAVSCYVAQRLGARPLPAVLLSMLVLLSPIFLMRGLGAHGHEALTAHWLIIAALGVAAQRYRSWGQHVTWLLLLLGSVAIHFYLFFMVGCIWAAWWAATLWRFIGLRDVRATTVMCGVAIINVGLVLTLMLALGYFTYGLEVGEETGFGYFSAEVLTFLNPLSQAWFFNGTGLNGASRVLPGWLSPIGGQYEGQAYAGLGILLIGCVALAMAIRRCKSEDFKIVPLEWWALAGSLIGLFLFALGDQWVIGKLVVNIPFPSFLDSITQYIRSSGRLVWPLFYGLLFVSVLFLARHVRASFLVILLAAALWLQWKDVGSLRQFVRSGLADRFEATKDRLPFGFLNDSSIQTFFARHDKIIFLPGGDLPDMKPFLWLAARHDMSINVAYFARVSSQRLDEVTSATEDAIRSGILEPGAVYVMTKPELAKSVCVQSKVTCRTLDMAVLASRDQQLPAVTE